MKKAFLASFQVIKWLWRHRFWLPLSARGFLVAVLGWWLAFRFALDSYDYVLYAAGMVSLLVLALSLASVFVGAAWIAWHLRHLPPVAELYLEAEAMVLTGLPVPRLFFWPLLELRLHWEYPESVEVTVKRRGLRWLEGITPQARGEARQVVRWFMVRDIFGLARLGVRKARPELVRVAPASTKVTAHVTWQLLGGDALSYPDGPVGGEYLDMRRYAHGDSLRHVLWKVYGRTRELLVRTPERAITPSRSTIAYLVAGADDEASASAARAFIESGLLGEDFLFCADGASQPTKDPAEALLQIIQSASARQRGGEGLERFLKQIDAGRQHNFLLFVPASEGRWLKQVANQSTRLHGGKAITALDERPSMKNNFAQRIRRLLLASEDESAQRLAEVSAVLKQLAALGLNPQLLHRPSGEFLPQFVAQVVSNADVPGGGA